MPDLPDISNLRSLADQAIGQRDSLLKRQVEVKAEIRGLKNEEAKLALVSQLLRALADAEVSSGVEAVTKLQTEGLQEIFHDRDISLEAEISESRGKVSVELMTVDRKPGGEVIRDSGVNSFGGSVLTVESVLLRIIVIMRRGLRPLLLLDETLGAVAKTYVERVALFLQALCDRMPGGMDVISVTHDPLLIDAAQRAYVAELQPSGAVSFKERR